MSDLFSNYVRRQFPVSAVRVTTDNMKEIAEACGGRIVEGTSSDYIKVHVAFPLNDEQTKARVGDWVVKHGKSFKVFSDAGFRKSFEAAHRSGANKVDDSATSTKSTPTPGELFSSPAPKPKGITLGELNSVKDE